MRPGRLALPRRALGVSAIGRLEWLRSIWSILTAFALGALIGLYFPAWAPPAARIGQLYVTFLIMCVPPIMLTALSSSLARLLTNDSAGAHLRRIAGVFLTSMAIVASVAAAGMLLARPGGGLSEDAQLVIGHVLRNAESAAVGGGSWGEVLLSLVPRNMFAAIAEGNYPQILFVSVLLGLLLGFVRMPATERLLDLAELVLQLFQQAIAWSTYLLPLAVLGIVAGQVAQVGLGLLLALAKLLVTVLVVAVVLWCAAAFVVSKAAGVTWREQWQAMRRPLTFGFATADSMATMPLLMEALEEMKLPRPLVKLVVPLCVLIGRHGPILYGVIVLVFTMQLYGFPVTPTAMAAVIGGAVFASVVTAGMPAIPFLTALTVVAAPMGLPLEAVIPIFLAIMPVFDPPATVAVVQIQAAAAIMAIGRQGGTVAERQSRGAVPPLTPAAPR